MGGCLQKKVLNKSNKIALNYIVGIIVAAILFWSIWAQVKQQLAGTHFSWQVLSQNFPLLLLAVLLLPINILIESKRWQSVSCKAQNISFKESMQSVLCGIAFSIITPNRIGEYPGRIIFLKRKNIVRFIAVAILAVLAQLLVFVVLGSLGFLYFHSLYFTIVFKRYWILLVALLVLFLATFFFYEKWIVWFQKFSFFQRYETYTYLLQKFSFKEQITVLGLTILRVFVFSTQLVLLLWWNEISISFLDGLLMAFVFFLTIAVIPSFAFAELGIRGKMSLVLFAPVTSNAIGIVLATFMLWCINLLLPALVGYFFLLKNRLLKKK